MDVTLEADARADGVRGVAGKVLVFGIMERNGMVQVTVVLNVTAQTLFGLRVKTVRRGSIVYTDEFHSYDSLMFCGYRHLKIDNSKRFSSGNVHISGSEGFWSQAKERLINLFLVYNSVKFKPSGFLSKLPHTRTFWPDF